MERTIERWKGKRNREKDIGEIGMKGRMRR